MDVGDAPTEYRVSTNGKINSYVDSALKALPVRRCLPPRAFSVAGRYHCSSSTTCPLPPLALERAHLSLL